MAGHCKQGNANPRYYVCHDMNHVDHGLIERQGPVRLPWCVQVALNKHADGQLDGVIARTF